MRRRVVVTGMGAITPIGSGVEGLWAGLRQGHPAAGPITRFDASGLETRIAAEIRDFDPLDHFETKDARRLDRFAQLSIAVTRQALMSAGLKREELPTERTGVYIGSALGGAAYGEEQHTRYLSGGLGAVAPGLALAVFTGSGATHAAIDLGLRGPATSNANSCAAGLTAIGDAFRAIRHGEIDVALAGGAEAPLGPLTFGAFARIHAMTTRNECPASACRPFDKERDGFLMGEGAAVLLMEPAERAEARGVRPLAEVVGFAMTNDAYSMYAPRPGGEEAARCMRLALNDAALAPDEVDYVNAHATGTPAGDQAEAAAIRSALGPAVERALVSGTKGLHGHALGATGAIEAAITILAMAHGWLPPTSNLASPGPDCCLNHVPAGGTPARTSIAVKNAFGFGGINTCLVLRRWE